MWKIEDNKLPTSAALKFFFKKVRWDMGGARANRDLETLTVVVVGGGGGGRLHNESSRRFFRLEKIFPTKFRPPWKCYPIPNPSFLRPPAPTHDLPPMLRRCRQIPLSISGDRDDAAGSHHCETSCRVTSSCAAVLYYQAH